MRNPVSAFVTFLLLSCAVAEVTAKVTSESIQTVMQQYVDQSQKKWKMAIAVSFHSPTLHDVETPVSVTAGFSNAGNPYYERIDNLASCVPVSVQKRGSGWIVDGFTTHRPSASL